MEIVNIISMRKAHKEPYYDCVYEWEDIFSRDLMLQIEGKRLSKPGQYLLKARQMLSEGYFPLSSDLSKPLSLCFVMSVRAPREYRGVNALPIFIDVWKDGVEYLAEHMGDSPFYVTSLDAFNLYKQKRPNAKVRYMPLSVSDRYYSDGFKAYEKKSVGIIQMGRRNEMLHKWAMRYTSEHKDVDYVYVSKRKIQSGSLYTSTVRGDLGYVRTREEMISLLSSSRISLCAMPSMDNARKGAEGINYPTPRFYESAVLGCNLIGRYINNEETERLGLDGVCPNITSYEEFAIAADRALSHSLDETWDANKSFVKDNLTSMRVLQLKNDFNLE